jgi:hypothetical protein
VEFSTLLPSSTETVKILLPTSDLIQLGILALSALGIVGTAAYKVHKWAQSRFFATSFTLAFPILHFIHVTNVVGRDAYIEVARVGIWARLVITNSGSEPLLLTEIRGYEQDSPPRSTIALVKYVEEGEESIKVGGHISLPLRLEHHDAVTVWTVMECTLPKPLGQAFGEVYGIDKLIRAKHSRDILKNAAAGEKWVMEQVKPDLPSIGVQLVDLKFGPIGLRDPLVDIDVNGAAEFRERLSHLPLGFYNDIVRYSDRKNLAFRTVEASPFNHYIIEIVFHGGRTLRRRARIPTSLWFMHPERHFKSS